mmetsp:Transcript_31184/g.70141  ORF Transcript_31184/g.70141 Transcript_31184/m.70141 type:complete len:269 (+) Transcript_31184:819-1625(+)
MASTLAFQSATCSESSRARNASKVSCETAAFMVLRPGFGLPASSRPSLCAPLRSWTPVIVPENFSAAWRTLEAADSPQARLKILSASSPKARCTCWAASLAAVRASADPSDITPATAMHTRSTSFCDASRDPKRSESIPIHVTTLPFANDPFCAASFSRSTPINLPSEAPQHMLSIQRSASSEMKALVSAAFRRRVGTKVSSSLSTARLKFCMRSCRHTNAFLERPLRRLSQMGITCATNVLTAGATTSAECLAALRRLFKASNWTDH